MLRAVVAVARVGLVAARLPVAAAAAPVRSLSTISTVRLLVRPGASVAANGPLRSLQTPNLLRSAGPIALFTTAAVVEAPKAQSKPAKAKKPAKKVAAKKAAPKKAAPKKPVAKKAVKAVAKRIVPSKQSKVRAAEAVAKEKERARTAKEKERARIAKEKERARLAQQKERARAAEKKAKLQAKIQAQKLALKLKKQPKPKELEKPRRISPPFTFFVKDQMAARGNQSILDVMKSAGQKWKTMTKEQRAPYEAKTEAMKKQKVEEMKAWRLKYPKKPAAGFGLFVKKAYTDPAKRAELLKLSFQQRVQKLGADWRALSPEQRAPYFPK